MSFFFLLFSIFIHKPYCSCIPLDPIDDKQYDEYNLIAKGKVLKVSTGKFERTIVFAVETYYKGGEGQTNIKIITPTQEGECGIVVKEGENWLVFVYATGKDYRTELCTRTKTMNPKAWDYRRDEITSDIKFLEAKLKK